MTSQDEKSCADITLILNRIPQSLLFWGVYSCLLWCLFVGPLARVQLVWHEVCLRYHIDMALLSPYTMQLCVTCMQHRHPEAISTPNGIMHMLTDTLHRATHPVLGASDSNHELPPATYRIALSAYQGQKLGPFPLPVSMHRCLLACDL